MGREENKRVFQDTENVCKKTIKLREAIVESIVRQKMVSDQDNLPQIEKNVFVDPAGIVISKKRSFEAASAYRSANVCVHNFASATTPGGGVTRGANAQEECLCRCSTLYFCLNSQQMWERFYTPHRMTRDSLHNDDIIYTPSVVVIKTDTTMPVLMPEEEWYKVNVVTCAAPNLRDIPGNLYNVDDGDTAVKIDDKKLLSIHEKRLRRILDIALLNKNEVVILGAFGCGAFSNNPEVVAMAARNVIKEYRHAFVTIEFAIYCNPWDMENYMIFKKILEEV